jgi:predicted HAD superfamily Cof-like phosphohydrolase
MTQERESEIGLVDAVDGFMRIAGQTTGKFNARQACLYTGLVLEEVGEMIDVIIGGTLTESQRAHLFPLSHMLRHFAKEFRDGMHEGDILRCNHAELLDAQFDTAWVAIGALMSTSAYPENAIAHGTFTNLDKFRDGKCLRDANGKVQKPPGWSAPDFTPYTDPTPRV